MKSRRLKMSLAEYHRLPFNLAWKQEYINGYLVESPRDVLVHTVVPVGPRATASPVPLRPASKTDERALLSSFGAAFAETIEFCNYTAEQFLESARQSLRRCFHGATCDALSVSRVALAPDRTSSAGRPIGAALLTLHGQGWALLDILFILPEWQRQGIATAMAAAALTALHELGGYRTLVSRYHLGNEASVSWHHRFGFVDEPDLRLAQLRLRAAEHEIRRHSQLGAPAPEIQSRLSEDCDRWRREVERLEAALNSGHREEAFPCYKWPSRERA